MKATELRIGNLIKEEKDGTIATVKGLPADRYIQYSIGRHPKQIYGEPLSWFIPIPLTEDWLYKFGIVELKNYGIHSDYGFNNFSDHSFRITADGEGYWYYSNANTVIHLTHVHQLQNLYFALTGEELTIKE